jgi:hypothetical protein
VGRADAPPLVCVPGYGAGAAFFFKNIGPLSAAGYRVHAVDWRGTGLSGRPPFAAGSHGDAVAFFLDALEAWRHANGIERFSLLGAPRARARIIDSSILRCTFFIFSRAHFRAHFRPSCSACAPPQGTRWAATLRRATRLRTQGAWSGCCLLAPRL